MTLKEKPKERKTKVNSFDEYLVGGILIKMTSCNTKFDHLDRVIDMCIAMAGRATGLLFIILY